MNRIRERRNELGMSQPTLAAMLRDKDPRIDVPMISRFETGTCFPSPDVLAALETALQADRSELFDDLAQFVIGNTKSEFAPSTAILAGLIPYEEPIGREALSLAYGESDRKTREDIERARLDGLPICNDQDGRGYYQTNDLTKLKRQYRQVNARGIALMRQARTIQKKIREIENGNTE